MYTRSHKVTTWTILVGGVVTVALLCKLLIAPWNAVEGAFALLAMAASLRGLATLKQHPHPARLLVVTLTAAVVFGPIVTLLALAGPLVASHTRIILNGPHVVTSALSPDRRYQAYVVDEPAMDGPDQTLYVEHSDGTRYAYITELPADVDAIRAIHWSPAGELVVFHTHCSLIAVRVPGYQSVRIPLIGEWKRKQPFKGNNFRVMGGSAEIAAIAFPSPDVCSYRFAAEDQDHLIDLNTLCP